MGKVNYDIYQFSIKEIVLFALQGICLIGCISYFFYDSVYALLFGLPFLFFFFRRKKEICKKRRKEQLTMQFMDSIQSFSAALMVGYSIENAWREAYEDLKLLHKKEEDLMVEIQYMIRQMDNNGILEQLLLDFARRSGISDIWDFAQIFAIAKRSGGDLNGIIKKSVDTICAKIEVKREIQIAIASKKYEQKVMSVIPIGIIAYIRFTTPHYFDVLYHNVAGVLIMSVCLFIYGFAFLMSEKIMEIEVDT